MRAASIAVPVKAAALLCAVAGVSLAADITATWVLAAVALLCLAFQRRWRMVVSCAAFYLVLALLLYLIRHHDLRMLVFSEFYVLLAYSLMPAVMAGWDLATTPPGLLSSALSKVHAPTPAILGLLVVFRFLPTMRSEFSAVWQSMRNRGLARAAHVARHPFRTCEYVLVPLLLRILQVADRLSASAVARGADAPGVRGSYYERAVGPADWVWLAIWVAATVAFLAVGGVR